MASHETWQARLDYLPHPHLFWTPQPGYRSSLVSFCISIHL